MKKIFFAFCLGLAFHPGVSFAAAGTPWSDIVENGTYILTEDLTQAPLKFHKGDRFDLLEASGLGSVPADYFELKAQSCVQPDLVVSDFIMIRPEGTPKGADGAVGVLLGKECHLKIYVDTREAELPSFLAPVTP